MNSDRAWSASALDQPAATSVAMKAACRAGLSSVRRRGRGEVGELRCVDGPAGGGAVIEAMEVVIEAGVRGRGNE